MHFLVFIYLVQTSQTSVKIAVEFIPVRQFCHVLIDVKSKNISANGEQRAIICCILKIWKVVVSGNSNNMIIVVKLESTQVRKSPHHAKQ